MRDTASQTLSVLAGKQPLRVADLFTITLLSGTIYRWTSFDQSILYTYGGDNDTYLAQGPLIQRTKVGVKPTVEVPELTLKLSALDSDFVGGLGIKQQLHNGFFDGASVALDRVFITLGVQTPFTNTILAAIGAQANANSLHPPGYIFSGRMSEAKITATGAEITAKGANVLMNQYVPRNLYQLPCIHTFCDPGCTLLAATFTSSFTAGSASTRSFVTWASAPGSPGDYTMGVLSVTSGAAIGQIRTVKLATAAGLLLQYPLYNVLAPGDGFTLLKGCDKTFNSGSGQSCTSYANTQHFRAFPYVPVAETAFALALLGLKVILSVAAGLLSCGMFT